MCINCKDGKAVILQPGPNPAVQFLVYLYVVLVGANGIFQKKKGQNLMFVLGTFSYTLSHL